MYTKIENNFEKKPYIEKNRIEDKNETVFSYIDFYTASFADF